MINEPGVEVTIEPITIYRAVEDDEIEGWGIFRHGSMLLSCPTSAEAHARARQFGFKVVEGEAMGVDWSGARHFVSAACRGERCTLCHRDATHKLGEEIMADDPNPTRHNLVAYVCCTHFTAVVRTGCGG